MTGGEIGVVGPLAFAFDAHGVRGTPRSVLERTSQCRFKPSRLSLAYQATHCALRITRCRVNQETLHGPRRIAEVAVKALAERRTPVAAIEAQLIDEYMSKRVEQHELGSDISV